jgi:hypothetical protein
LGYVAVHDVLEGGAEGRPEVFHVATGVVQLLDFLVGGIQVEDEVEDVGLAGGL